MLKVKQKTTTAVAVVVFRNISKTDIFSLLMKTFLSIPRHMTKGGPLVSAGVI